MPRRKYPWLPYKYEKMLIQTYRRYEVGLIGAIDVQCVENYISRKLQEEADPQGKLDFTEDNQ